MSGLLSLFLVFSRIGVFGFGGGYAMLPLIFQSVERFGFMSAAEFSNLVALSQIVPGPVAVNAATYVGFHVAGLPGAAAATLGVAIPSFCMVALAAHFLEKFKASKGPQAVLYGIRPATVGLIAAAVVLIARTSLIGDVSASAWLGAINIVPCLIFIATFALIAKFKISPIKIILAMGAIGALAGEQIMSIGFV